MNCFPVNCLHQLVTTGWLLTKCVRWTHFYGAWLWGFMCAWWEGAVSFETTLLFFPLAHKDTGNERQQKWSRLSQTNGTVFLAKYG